MIQIVRMVQHLLVKALMETSADRAEYLSRLFSRPRPAGLDSTSSVTSIFNGRAANYGELIMLRP